MSSMIHLVTLGAWEKATGTDADKLGSAIDALKPFAGVLTPSEVKPGDLLYDVRRANVKLICEDFSALRNVTRDPAAGGVVVSKWGERAQKYLQLLKPFASLTAVNTAVCLLYLLLRTSETNYFYVGRQSHSI
jgi:hypothetical protein